MRDKPRATLYVLLCVALWALIPVVAKLGQSRLDNHQFLFWSSLVSFAVIALTVLLTGRARYIRTYTLADWLWFSFLGLLGTYIYYLFLYLGYSRSSGMEVLVIQYTWPILIVVLSVFILKERLDMRKGLAILLGFVGVVLVLTRGEITQINVSDPAVISLVALGAGCFALFSVLSKRVTREALGVVAVYFLVATFASLGSMLALSEFALPQAGDLLPILLNGVLVNGFSYVFWTLALRSAEASYLAPFTFITPVLSAVYLIVFFREPFVIAYGIGLVLVVAGGLINTAGRRNSRLAESN